jgi:hypothetical protein
VEVSGIKEVFPGILELGEMEQEKILLFVAVLWFELRASHLLGRCSTILVIPPALLALTVFFFR